MRLLRFTASNLFSLGEIELDLDRRGLVLITGFSHDEGGANGSGKSSLSNKGILWTLFGSTASGERADAAINKFAQADATCSGTLDLESNSGGHFRVVRSRCPNRLSLIDMATGGDLSAKTEKETQVLINKVIGRTRETFLQTDFFGQGKSSAFLDLTPKAQVEVLETILPFDRLAELSDKAKEFLSKLGFVQASIERKLNEQQGKQMEAQRQERVLSTAIDKWDRDHDVKLADLEAKVTAASIEDFDTIVEQLKQRCTEIPNEHECATAYHECEDYLQMLLRIEVDIKGNLQQRRAELARLHPCPPIPNVKVCPTCDQPISNEILRDLRAANQDYESQKTDIQMSVLSMEQDMVSIGQRRQEMAVKEREIEQALTQLKLFERQIADAENRRNNGELAILRQNLVDAKAEVNPYTELYQQTANIVNMTTQNVTAHKARMIEVEKDNGALAFWRDAFGKELKNELLNQVCPFVEKRANQHLHGLGNAQLTVSIGTRKLLKSDEERSEFTVTAASRTGGGDYSSLSGGERQLVSFAMGLALADLAELQTDGPSQFMVLDEPFMALDTRNSENLVNYLNSYLNGKKETILLVSNEETLKSLIPNRITVVKENGVSRIE